METGFQGLALNAPASLDVRQQARLPVALGTGRTTRRLWEVAQEKNLVLLASDLEAGVLYLAKGYPPPEKEPAMQPASRRMPEPKERPPYARMAKIELLEPRERLNLRWKPAHLALTVISYDWRSNTAEVELVGDEPPEEGRRAGVRPSPAPPETGAEPPLPCYEPSRLSPQPPADGVEFSLRTETAPMNSLPVYGAVAIRARRRRLDRTGSVHPGVNGKARPLLAVVPMTLLVFALGRELPLRMDWAVPVDGAEPVQEGSLLKGYFAVDLLRSGGPRPALGPQRAYLVLDSHVCGPREFQI